VGCLSHLQKVRYIAKTLIWLALLTDEVPPFSVVLALPDPISPDSCITDVEGIGRLDKVFHKLRCIFREVMLCKVADCAVTKTTPTSHIAGKREESKGVKGVEHGLYATRTAKCEGIDTREEV
jgi:hypothetical protein